MSKTKEKVRAVAGNELETAMADLYEVRIAAAELESREKVLREYISVELLARGIDKFESSGLRASMVVTTKVEAEVEKLPVELTKIVADTAAIRAAFEGGRKRIPGVEVVERTDLRVNKIKKD